LSALNSAQKGIDLYAKEIAFLDPFLDAGAGFVAIGKCGIRAGGRRDQGAASDNRCEQKAMALSQPPAIPTELGATLKALQQVLTDIQALLAAVEANDAAGIQKYATTVEPRRTTLASTTRPASRPPSKPCTSR